MNQLVTKPANCSGTTTDAARAGGILTHPLLHISILVALTLYSFGRSVTGYFLADDFGHIGVIRSIMQGRTDLFWANFAGNFNQIPGMSVYRPFQLTTELVDYALFKGNASGWYASNLIYFAGVMIVLYLLCRELFRAWGVWRSSLIGLLSAGLVAVSPLHCESVSWMVGRVDAVACLFYLISFYIFIRSKTWRGKSLAIASFIYAIGNKEMPVMLPIVVLAYYVLGLNDAGAGWQPDQGSGFKLSHVFARLKAAFITCAPYWVTLLVYFAIRAKCLGTVGGGYVGGFGATVPQMIAHWTDPDTLHRIFFAFNAAVVPEPNIYSKILAACYAVVAVLATARLLLGTTPWRWLAFVSVWFATCAIPIYSVWGLGYNLEGGRFYFFVSLPLGVMVVLLALAPFARAGAVAPNARTGPVGSDAGDGAFTPDASSDFLKNFDWRATALGVAALSLAILILARVASMTNAAWVHAGREIRKFADACVQVSDQDPTKPTVILGIPEDHAGAHQLLNGRTFTKLFMQPFMDVDRSNRFVNFLPMIYGPSEIINATRFRDCIASRLPVYLWSSATNQLSSINISSPIATAPPIVPQLGGSATSSSRPTLTAQTGNHQIVSIVNGSILMSNVKADDGIRIDSLKVPTIDYDFLEFDARFVGGANERTIKVSWTPTGKESSIDGSGNCATAVLSADTKTKLTDGSDISSRPMRHVRVRLSHFWRWFATPQVSSLFIQPGVATIAEVRNIRLVGERTITPHLSLVGPQENTSGYREMAQPPLTVQVDGREVEGAASTLLEITKTNFFFDRFEQSDDRSMIGSTIAAPLHGPVTVDGATLKKVFPSDGFYQIHIRCLDAQGNPVGEPSDPISVHFSKSSW